LADTTELLWESIARVDVIEKQKKIETKDAALALLGEE
jgi:hypothetical protein